MNYYCIENDGEIDINAFRLIGATTKDETQIGYFGSGIKFALATALRNSIDIKAFSGKKEITISTDKVTMRDIDFDVISIDNTKTSITTQMGRDWQPWFILREFYCNAIDEGSNKIQLSDNPQGVKGKTRIYIQLTSEIHDVVSNFDQYFSVNRKPIHSALDIHVYPRSSNDHMTIYRRGVRVFDKLNSIYDYDMSSIDINEARETSSFSIEWGLVSFWKSHATIEMIMALISKSESFEFGMHWDYAAVTSLNNEWLKALEGKTIIPKEIAGYHTDALKQAHVILPHSLCKCLHETFGLQLNIAGINPESNNADFLILEPQPKELKMIDWCIDFIASFDIFSKLRSYEVLIAALPTNILGTVKDDTIYIDPQTFKLGKHMLVETLIEEYIHIESQSSDYTRSFQNALINTIITFMEESRDEFI